MQITQGHLLEENHYYPFGLPAQTMSSTAAGSPESRRKYQGNEYIKDLGLNWMDFNARQYDPQLGRFLGVDPKAAAGGQDKYSPYAAMGNMPESMVDPNGEQFEYKGAMTSRQSAFLDFAPGSFAWQGMGMDMAKEEAQHISMLVELEQWRAARDAQDAAATAGNTTTSATQGGGTPAGNNMGAKSGNSAGGAAAGALIGASSSDYQFGGNKKGVQKAKKAQYTLFNYSLFSGSFKEGLDVTLAFTDDLSGYSATGWIQNVATDNMINGLPPNEQFNDYDRTDPNNNAPFYYGKDEWTKKKLEQLDYNYGGKYFGDAPSRFNKDENYYWFAELTLVGLKRGTWVPIASFHYGFIDINSFIFRIPFFSTGKHISDFQQSLIDGLNKK